MEFANQLILIGALLLLLSIFVGLISSRIGAPLLLVFLGLGMLFGEDGPGGILFNNYQAAYLIGSISLAVILFDGGLRTDLGSFRLAARPAILLATVGVAVTAALTGMAAHGLLGLGPIESFLIGAIVGSTDAAAVFFLLHLHGLDIRKRVRAVLEVESGLNDPMAVFLTVAAVELLARGGAPSWFMLADFALQLVGGAAIGVAAGVTLVWLINRLDLAQGLYPVLALAFALFMFAVAQAIGASGFLAVYLAGLVVGNRRHRATQLINRFHDGLSWLAQMVMFLMLGLLVTPSALLESLLPGVLIALFLVLVARPAAVVLCLLPFRFTWREQAFVAWVGLRGAVAIFLGTIPILMALDNGALYFDVAFAVVLVSLLVQGWTVAPAARLLDLELPPLPEPPQRIDVGIPAAGARDLVIYTVRPNSRVLDRGLRRLWHMDDTSVVSIIRDGRIFRPRRLEGLEPGDCVLIVAPPEQSQAIDQLFAGATELERDAGLFGEFSFGGEVEVGRVADFYDLGIAPEARDMPLSVFVRERLGRVPVIGDRLTVGGVEFVVESVDGDTVTRVGIELAPEERPRFLPLQRLRAWLRGLARGPAEPG